MVAGTAGTREKIVLVGWIRGGREGERVGGQLSKLDGIVRYRTTGICEPLLGDLSGNGEWMMGCWEGRGECVGCVWTDRVVGDENVIESRGRNAVSLKVFGKVFMLLSSIELNLVVVLIRKGFFMKFPRYSKIRGLI